MIGMDFKRFFFDRKAVKRKVDTATRKVLSRFGAFVRQGSRRSIRKRKSISTPGSPPSSHTGLLKRFIFFGYDTNRRSVVIGPVRLTRRGRGEAPSLLEHGGSGRVDGKRAKYKARPYMGPAFNKELPKLPAMWRNSVR